MSGSRNVTAVFPADTQGLLRRIARAGWLPAFAALLLCWQSGLFLALSTARLSLGQYAGAQGLGCLLPAVWLTLRLGRPQSDPRDRIAVQMLVWSGLAGPFGAFVALGLLVPQEPAASRFDRQAVGAGGPDGSPAPLDAAERVQIGLLDKRVRLEGAARIRPLLDVMTEGSREERLEALRVIYKRYDRDLGPALRQALQDPDSSVRVLAATVIASLNGKFGLAIGKRLSEAAASPEAGGGWRRLAEARLDYARSGLLERSRARAQILSANEDLARATRLDPSDPAQNARLVDAQRELARHDDAFRS